MRQRRVAGRPSGTSSSRGLSVIAISVTTCSRSGPGYGATTDVFRERVARLTAVEIDPTLARNLADRLAGTNVEVIEGDATAMDFDDGRFTGATCFAMLHHVPSTELQDQLVRRGRPSAAAGGAVRRLRQPAVARPRGLSRGRHVQPDRPDAVANRLRRAGFVDIELDDERVRLGRPGLARVSRRCGSRCGLRGGRR